MAPVIAMLSDFGYDDPYVGIMKGVILQHAADVQFVDLGHKVTAGDILQGALQLRSATPYFPPGTIFLAVVDPGVGGARRPIAARTSRHTFVGPDNGLLSLALARETVEAVVHLSDSRYHLPEVSHTFHGRDVFAPVAAHLANGLALQAFGPEIHDWQTITLPSAERVDGQIAGVVLEIDRFGNLCTNIPRTMLPISTPVSLKIAGYVLNGISDAYGDVPPGRLLALVGSQETLEIACRNGSAQDKLGVDRGQPVVVTWST